MTYTSYRRSNLLLFRNALTSPRFFFASTRLRFWLSDTFVFTRRFGTTVARTNSTSHARATFGQHPSRPTPNKKARRSRAGPFR
ncbi:hypothetical protein [Jannaschia donghaensis]|uniref:Uncharacterized protein n=1 Tax=Jannaschia donghaensis TaxID=420998 RepID=A0A0M6YJJ8_9RHOB|nr:hypothetical protein JDO7802_01852 [Jannaschia donghaensis]